MIRIRLTKAQQAELEAIEECEVLELEYNGLPAFITVSPYGEGNCEINGRLYDFDFYHPTEVKIIRRKN